MADLQSQPLIDMYSDTSNHQLHNNSQH